MSGEMLGANPEDLRALAKLMATSSEKLDNTVNMLQPTIEHSRWFGGDAARFRSDWAGKLRPQLHDSVQLLKSTSKKLVQQAADQEQASAAEGAGSIRPDGHVVTREEAQAEHQKDLRDQLAQMQGASKEDVEKWWKSLSDEDKQYLLSGLGDLRVPLAEQVAALGDKLPADAQEAARLALMDKARATTPVYKDKESIGIDGHAAWAHGGAHISTEITKNADGSATLKVAGDIGGGVNVPGAKDTGVTLTGEISRTYKFDSLADAQAALNQMTEDLPPDGVGDVKDAVSDPGGYLMDKLDNAAGKHGVTGHDDKAKGTLSLSAGADLGGDVKGSAKLDLAYEQNLSTGTSIASGALKLDAKVDLGEGLKLSGSGEVGMDLAMDKDHNIEKMTLNLKGTVEGSQEIRVDQIGTPEGQKDGFGTTFKGGVQGAVKMEIYNTPQNEALVQSFISNTASGNDAAAAVDLQKIYQSSGVTLQANTVATSENNLVDFDAKVASLKIGTKSEETVNVVTGYKAPHDIGYRTMDAADRK